MRPDVNAVVGGYLRDLAFSQSSQQKMFGYKRAAAAILALDVPLTDLAGPDGALPRISGIGPGSTRVINEILETGGSPTVERAIEESGRRDQQDQQALQARSQITQAGSRLAARAALRLALSSAELRSLYASLFWVRFAST